MKKFMFDLKYEPRVVKYVHHNLMNEKHDHCLVDLYNLYIRIEVSNRK